MSLNSVTRMVFSLFLSGFMLSVPVLGQDAPAVVGDRFYVLGEVNTPGDFELKPDTTVKSAIETAGGLSPRADINGGVLLQGDQKITLDLKGILAGTTPDIPLKSGDTVIVKPGTYRVEGKVKKPGRFDIRLNLSPLQALELAGGPEEGADLEGAYITRGDKTIPVDLSGTQVSETIQIGDVLTVPERTVTVTGEVQKPGMYPLIPGKSDRLLDAIAAAGGATSRANLKKVQVTLTQDGKTSTKTIDSTRVDVPENNPVLHRGDSVHVPSVGQKRRISLNDVYQGIIIIWTLVSIFD